MESHADKNGFALQKIAKKTQEVLVVFSCNYCAVEFTSQVCGSLFRVADLKGRDVGKSQAATAPGAFAEKML